MNQYPETYTYADTEYNLAKMEMECIKKAFQLYPKAPMPTIAKVLGISERHVYRKVDEHNLDLNKLRQLNKII